MGSYAELVIDRSVEAAWLQFRVRVADHLAAMEHKDTLTLGLRDGDGDWTVELLLKTWSGGFAALWEWADEQDRPLARHGRTMRVPRGAADAYVLHISRLLTDAGAPHPSFVEVVSGDLVLVDPPQDVAPPSEPALPDSVTPTSADELVAWVDRTLTVRLGRAPRKRPDGSVGISRDGDRLEIHVSDGKPIIEVWATVARDVDLRKARKRLSKLNASFHFFSFALVGDRLVVTTTVNGRPFCPAHLDRAINSTFAFLERDAVGIRTKLARKSPSDDGFDADLLLVHGASGDRKTMVEMARRLSGGSAKKLRRWHRAAADAGRSARKRAGDAEHGPLLDVLLDQVITWGSVKAALEDVLAEIADERESA